MYVRAVLRQLAINRLKTTKKKKTEKVSWRESRAPRIDVASVVEAPTTFVQEAKRAFSVGCAER